MNDIRNGHIVGSSSPLDGPATGAEWNTAGQIVRTFPIQPIAVNSGGLVVGRTIADNAPGRVGAEPDR